MRVRRKSRRVRGAAVLTSSVVAAAAAVAQAANPAPATQAATLHAQNASLAHRSRSAELNLYSLDARLTNARARLEALRVQQAALQRERKSVRRRQRITAAALHISQQELAVRLRTLYEQGDVDPIAVILGARSLDEAVTTLEDLNISATQDRDVIAQTIDTRRSLRTLDRRLAGDEARVSAAAASLAATAVQLAGAQNARANLIASLSRERRLNAAAIGRLEAAARAAEMKAATLNAQTPAATPTPAPPAPAPVPTSGSAAHGSTLTVTATGYSLGGRTATGVPVGWGVVAVDPSVIPLGTHMTIPGYGAGVAADTGGAVRGASIDLWFPSTAQALAWGRRVVTITLG